MVSTFSKKLLELKIESPIGSECTMSDPLTIRELAELAETAEYMASLPEAEEIDRAKARNLRAFAKVMAAEKELEFATEEFSLTNKALSAAGGFELH